MVDQYGFRFIARIWAIEIYVFRVHEELQAW